MMTLLAALPSFAPSSPGEVVTWLVGLAVTMLGFLIRRLIGDLDRQREASEAEREARERGLREEREARERGQREEREARQKVDRELIGEVHAIESRLVKVETRLEREAG